MIKQMTDQLLRKKYIAQGVISEKSLIATLTQVDPDVICIEINGITQNPIQDIVKIVFMWINNHARKVNKALNSPSARLWQKAKVVMFKSDPDEGAVNPAGVTLPQDLDEVLFKCKEAGNIEYIGLYSPWSFLAKLKPFLTRNVQN